jgi:hypothetical protein
MIKAPTIWTGSLPPPPFVPNAPTVAHSNLDIANTSHY